MNQASRRLPALLAAAGLLFSAILELVHFRAYRAPSSTSFCGAGPHLDCASVALSRFSVAYGVPLPIWGAAGFLAIALAARRRSALLVPLAGAAAFVSLILLGTELAVIRRVCLLCEAVHVLSWVLFIVVWRERNDHAEPSVGDAFAVLAAPALIIAGSHLVVPKYWNLFSWKTGVHLPHGVDTEDHPWIGAENPTVVVHEYSDYSCPHCALARSAVLRVLSSHPATLKLVHHDFPRMSCPKLPGLVHCQYARAAVCGGAQSKFWETDAWLFEHAPGRSTVDFQAATRDLGLNPDQFNACMADQQTFDTVDAANRAALRSHIQGTPTFVIDGKQFLGTSVLDELDKRL